MGRVIVVLFIREIILRGNLYFFGFIILCGGIFVIIFLSFVLVGRWGSIERKY